MSVDIEFNMQLETSITDTQIEDLAKNLFESGFRLDDEEKQSKEALVQELKSLKNKESRINLTNSEINLPFTIITEEKSGKQTLTASFNSYFVRQDSSRGEVKKAVQLIIDAINAKKLDIIEEPENILAKDVSADVFKQKIQEELLDIGSPDSTT
jgi:hypothetical protein